MSLPLAVVSGASSNIGKAIVTRLQSDGYSVIGLSRKCATYPCDVTNSDQCREVIKRIADDNKKSVALLINNHGININKLLLRTSASEFSDLIQTNVIGCTNLIKACLKDGGMLQAKNGCIVNMSSVVGIRGNAGQVAYAATKASLLGITKSLASEYGQYNIRCNALCPALIANTGMTNALDKAQRARFLETCALKRLGTVEEVADAVSFLARNTYVNGHTLVLDGGLI